MILLHKLIGGLFGRSRALVRTQFEGKSESGSESEVRVEGGVDVAGGDDDWTHPPLPLPLRGLRIPFPVLPSSSLPPSLNPSQSATLLTHTLSS